MTKTFRELGVDPALCDALEARDITHPFPIQELTLPLALDGHDLIGQARTGTGKTLAFGLPLLQRVDAEQRHTQALVIVPTRELCLQVHADLEVGNAKGLSALSVYGGVGYDEQINALGNGVQVVVGTPGRLLDLFQRGDLDLSKVTQLVLDEADEMLDMGFLADVERLVAACTGENRHTMLFSATMPTAIVKLARRYMDHPTFTRADHEQKNTAPQVTQHFFQVHRMDKPRLLARILQDKGRGGVFVFVRTKHMADRLVNDLQDLRVPSIAIHGDLRQQTREKNLDRFRSGKATVLVCTEVAARGLDISGVTHVVNYDCPDDEKMYLHRIGRTARAGESGVAVTFAEFNEIDRLNVIRKAVAATDTEVEQVFSTSKTLEERFDLPAERPWDHLKASPSDDSAKSSGGSSERKGRSDRRRGSADGRSKNSRANEGRGGAHNADRKRSDERRTSNRAGRNNAEKPSGNNTNKPAGKNTNNLSGKNTNTEVAREDRADTRTKADRTDRRSRENGADTTTRTRTRTRTRENANTTTDQPKKTQEAAETSRKDDQQSASSGRTRARASGRTRARGGARVADRNRDDKRSDSPSGSNRNNNRTGSNRSDKRSDSRTGSNRSDKRSDSRTGGDSNRRNNRSNNDSRQKTDHANTRDNAADRDERSTNRRQNERDQQNDDARPRARRNRPRGSRSGQNQQQERPSTRGNKPGGNREQTKARTDQRKSSAERRRGGKKRGERVPSSTAPVVQRGVEARGDGQPAPTRRVKVEHLP